MKDGFIISVLSVIPKKPVARFMGWSARISLPRFFHKILVRYFVWKYDVNLEECQGEIEDFNSLSEFFVRALKDGRRTIAEDSDVIVSPVDGRVHAVGRIKKGAFFQSAEQNGSVSELLGAELFDEKSEYFDPKDYQDGMFAIIYLSPQDYHRVHNHREGQLKAARYLPGKLWPVFPAATRKIAHLFDRNERLVFAIQEGERKTISAMIGAFGVGRMTSSFVDTISNEKAKQLPKQIVIDTALARAQEIGQFELGSTVVILCNYDVDWNIAIGEKLQLGQKIATIR